MAAKVINTLVLVGLFVLVSFQPTDLKTENLKSGRVKRAYKNHWSRLRAELRQMDCNPESVDLFIRVFKHEKELEIWVKSSNEQQFQRLKTLAICASSGSLGPKRRQGDLQVPEGFYTIPSLHPYSNYHLALKVGYPNAADRIKATAKDPGGDIMIHGSCVTIGCIPLRDEPVEELYLLALEARSRGRNVQCHIFPYRFGSKGSETLANAYPEATQTFWKSLKKGYDYFELNHSLPAISVDKQGNYLIKNEN